MSWVRNFRRHVWHYEVPGAPRFICGSFVSSKGIGGLATEVPQSYRLCRNCEWLYVHGVTGAMAYRGQSMRP